MTKTENKPTLLSRLRSKYVDVNHNEQALICLKKIGQYVLYGIGIYLLVVILAKIKAPQNLLQGAGVLTPFIVFMIIPIACMFSSVSLIAHCVGAIRCKEKKPYTIVLLIAGVLIAILSVLFLLAFTKILTGGR